METHATASSKDACRLCACVFWGSTYEHQGTVINLRTDIEKCFEITTMLQRLNTPVDLRLNEEGFSATVCHQCYNSLQNAYEFVNMVDRASTVCHEIFCRLCGTVLPENKLSNLRRDVDLCNDIIMKLTRLNVRIDFINNKLPATVCFECCSLLQDTYLFMSSIDNNIDVFKMKQGDSEDPLAPVKIEIEPLNNTAENNPEMMSPVATMSKYHNVNRENVFEDQAEDLSFGNTHVEIGNKRCKVDPMTPSSRGRRARGGRGVRSRVRGRNMVPLANESSVHEEACLTEGTKGKKKLVGKCVNVSNTTAVSDIGDKDTTDSPIVPPKSLHDARRAIINYGSEEESEDEEVEGSEMLVPRAAWWNFANSDDEEDLDDTGGDREGCGQANEFRFEWNKFPADHSSEDRREKFLINQTGPVFHFETPLDAFLAIWDRELITTIANNTNKYAQEYTQRLMNAGALGPSSRMNWWTDSTADELYIYFAIILAMGVVCKTSYEEYWAKDDDIFVTPNFRAQMPLRRFQQLNRCIHFQDNNTNNSLQLTPPQAKLVKIQPIIDHLNKKFSESYILGRNIALDESLNGWRGLCTSQRSRNKKAKGIKTYEVCESQTGYLWRFEVHAGPLPPTTTRASPLSGPIPSLIMRLLRGLEHKGYTVWLDNYYNSPALARHLKNHGFDCAGTLRTNRRFVPMELKTLRKNNMSVGELVGYTSGDVDVMVWKDRKCVGLISTYHGNAVSLNDGVWKPNLVRDYDMCMGGVDKKDQMLAMYPCERRRTTVWYKKLFRRLLNVSALNSYILFKNSAYRQNASQKNIAHRAFRKQLIKQLLEYAEVAKSQVVVSTTTDRKLPADIRAHFPAEYDFYANSHNRMRRICVQCKKRVSTYCPACKVPLCVFTCFNPYHT